MAEKIIYPLFVALFCLPVVVCGQTIEDGQLAGGQDEVRVPANQSETFEAKVLEVLEIKEVMGEDGKKVTSQELRLEGLSGKWKNREPILAGAELDYFANSAFKKGDGVVVSYDKDANGHDIFYVTNFIRRGKLYFLAAIFLAIILLVGRWWGFRAILGLVFSLLVIIKFIIPKILTGGNPLYISLVYSFIIIIVGTYLVYGLNKKSSVSILGISLSIAVVGILSVFFANLCRLAGFAQEETIFITGLTGGAIDLRGLLLAGFIIGALGVLDDLAVSQVSVVQELHKLNPGLPKMEIYKRAMRVGVDHISSMVNTLFLAYAGVSLPLLLLFTFKQPPFETFGQVINHEVIAIEIIRTLVGSIGLAVAAPITTFLAAHFYARKINN
ncbi:YibE/F family protein [Candidatus Falkowbacteria bacterium]|nr:YibE/F family protein [Candidatus Falkowbacteria bacterium]